MQQPLNIVFICHFFAPEVCAPASRVGDLARLWSKAGHRVHVVTCFPNHPTGKIPERYRRLRYLRETMDGYEVHRSYVYARPGGGFVRRTLGHLTFMVSSVLLTLRRLHRPDVIVVSSPTLFSVVSAYCFHRATGAPFVFEVRDLWPEAFPDLGITRSRVIIGGLSKLAMALYRRAKHVVVVTRSFEGRLIERGVPPEKISVIYNGVDLDRFADSGDGDKVRAELDLREERLVLYAGAHGVSHGLEAVLDAAEACRDLDGWRFVLMGEGSEKRRLVEDVGCRGLRNVTFIDGQPSGLMPSIYRVADICLVTLGNAPILETFVPSKMFEIMACERPIVAALAGESREILASSGAAEIVDPGDGRAIAEAVRRLASDPSRRQLLAASGKKFATTHFDRVRQADTYLRLLAEVAQQK